MTDPGLVRALGLFVPALGAWFVWAMRPPDVRRAAGALLACAYQLPALALLNTLAPRLGLWHFEAVGGLFLGMPVDLLLGWVILWGLVPIVALPNIPILALALGAGWLDLLLMPRLAPVLHLDRRWLVGEAFALVLCFVPAQLLARWTWRDEHLGIRAALQALCFSGLLLGLLPALILEKTGGCWQLGMESGWAGGIFLQILALPAVFGLSAVQEFVERGRGTPLPWDSPKHLVTSGAYRYVANPMQVSISIVLVGWGLVLGSLLVAAAGLMSIVYSAGLASWDETDQMRSRFGEGWVRYRSAVGVWWPRFRPYVASPAQLWVARGCDPCSRLESWIRRAKPVGLEILPAELHPSRDLTRLTYDPGNGGPEEGGLRALSRALEHIHFGWAFCGFLMRLPGVCPLLQLVADACGGDPRALPRRPERARP